MVRRLVVDIELRDNVIAAGDLKGGGSDDGDDEMPRGPDGGMGGMGGMGGAM